MLNELGALDYWPDPDWPDPHPGPGLVAARAGQFRLTH
jgi:hypothetical protein